MKELNLKQNLKVCGFQNLSEEHLVERLMELGFVLNQQLKYKGQVSWNGAHLVQVENSIIALRDEEFKCLNLENI